LLLPFPPGSCYVNCLTSLGLNSTCYYVQVVIGWVDVSRHLKAKGLEVPLRTDSRRASDMMSQTVVTASRCSRGRAIMRIRVKGMGGTTVSTGPAIMQTVHGEEPSFVWHSEFMKFMPTRQPALLADTSFDSSVPCPDALPERVAVAQHMPSSRPWLAG
jgi:hypothetical protein